MLGRDFAKVKRTENEISSTEGVLHDKQECLFHCANDGKPLERLSCTLSIYEL